MRMSCREEKETEEKNDNNNYCFAPMIATNTADSGATRRDGESLAAQDIVQQACPAWWAACQDAPDAPDAVDCRTVSGVWPNQEHPCLA